jgi:hypothetical protein
MATINGTAGADVINDTIGDDVINTLGSNGNTVTQKDVVNLSGGNDVINIVAPAPAPTAINVITDYQNKLTVNGDMAAIVTQATTKIGELVINDSLGSVYTLKGVTAASPNDFDYQTGPAGAQIGLMDGGLGFDGGAASIDIDFRNAQMGNNWGPVFDMFGVSVEPVSQLSAHYGAAGGFVHAELLDVTAITMDSSGGSQTGSAGNYADIGVGGTKVGTFSADFSSSKMETGVSIATRPVVYGDEFFHPSFSSVSFNGSHGNNLFSTDVDVQSAFVNTFEGNDEISLRNIQSGGTADINVGAGDDVVSLHGDGSDGVVKYIRTGEGNDTVLSSVLSTVTTGSGADKVWGDRGLFANGETYVFNSNSQQTIDLGASGAAQTGNVTFRINAYSSLVDGVGAHASVYAGGKKIGEFQANNNATTGQDFTITTAAANLLNGELAILFDNDKYIAATSTAAAQDRNLYIREVEMTDPDGSKQMLWNKSMSTDSNVVKPTYDQYNSGAPAGVNSAFDGQNLRTYTPYSTGTIGMAWGGALKFNVDTQVSGIDIADGGNGSDTYLFDRNSGRDLYRDTGTQAGDVDVLKFAADARTDQIWLSRDAQAKIHVGIIGTNNDAVINGIDQLQAGGKTLAAADFDKLIQAMASVTPPTMGQLDLNTTQHQKLDTVIAANWH